MINDCLPVNLLGFRSHRTVVNPSFEGRIAYFALDLLIDAQEDTWHGSKYGWLKDARIVHHVARVT